MKIEMETSTLSSMEIDAIINFLNELKGHRLVDDEITSDDGAPKELSDAEVLKIVHKMHDYALGLEFEKSFKATELYRAAIQGKWIDLSPNTRKAIGRQFKKVADEYYEKKDDGALVVTFKERNIQNTAIYHVVQKDSL